MWKDLTPTFEGVQERGAGDLILPEQLVKKDSVSSETSKLGACLDANVQNRIVFKGEHNMEDFQIFYICGLRENVLANNSRRKYSKFTAHIVQIRKKRGSWRF